MFRLGRCGAVGAAGAGAPGAAPFAAGAAAPLGAGPLLSGAAASTSACGGGWRGGDGSADGPRGPPSPWPRCGRSESADSLGRRSEDRPGPW